jgi:hypothetical protein
VVSRLANPSSIQKLLVIRQLMMLLKDKVSEQTCKFPSSAVVSTSPRAFPNYGVHLVELDPVTERKSRLKIDLMTIPTIAILNR